VKIAMAVAEVIRGTVDLQASEARLMARLADIERRIPR
jgi:hypothetical protein